MTPNRRSFVKMGAAAGAGLLGLTGSASAADDSVVDGAPVVSSATYPTMGTDASNPTATVYGNFKCPYTQDFVLNNLDNVIRDFVETGRLNLQFRTVAYEPFPSNPSHGSSEWYISSSDPRISEASLGVWNVDPNDYWQYFLDMFQNQVSGYVTLGDLADRMAASGVEGVGAIRDRTAAGNYESEVVQSKQAARAANLQWTPWMEFEGDTVSPHHGYSGLADWLDARAPSASAATQSAESASFDRTLVVDGGVRENDAHYEFEVSGNVRVVGKTTEGIDSVGEGSVSGRVVGWADHYEFSGELTGFSIDGPAELALDGQSVSADDLPSL